MYKCDVDFEAGFLQRKPRSSSHLPIAPGDHSFPWKCIEMILLGGSCVLTLLSQDSTSFSNEEHSDFAPIRLIVSIQHRSLLQRKSFRLQNRSSVPFFASTTQSRCLAQCLDTYRRVGENVLSMEALSPGTSESKTYDERRLHMLKCRDCIMRARTP